MIITNDQIKLLETIINNKENLEELLKIASIKQISGKDIKIKESIEVAGITWSKFAEDENGNAFMLADECIYKREFGENNDWRESPIRKELNGDLYEKIIYGIGKDVVVPITVDLFSHDGLRDYGTCIDNISLLTYDLYRNNRKNIKACDDAFWTNTPDSTPSGCSSGYVQCVYSDGGVCCTYCSCNKGVRPFFILRA